MDKRVSGSMLSIADMSRLALAGLNSSFEITFINTLSTGKGGHSGCQDRVGGTEPYFDSLARQPLAHLG
jgi:hypothetical protein